MNAPDCRKAHEAGHVCHTKTGEPWDRGDVGPRPGTTCWWETLQRLEDDRLQEADDIARWAAEVASLTTLEQVVAS